MRIQIRDINNKTNRIHLQVESGNLINKNMIRQEIDQDIDLDKMDDKSGDENPYRELIVNNEGSKGAE